MPDMINMYPTDYVNRYKAFLNSTPNLLTEQIKTSYNDKEVEELKKIKQPQRLEQIALDPNVYWLARQNAISRINNQNIFESLALHDPDKNIRSFALKCIRNQQLIESIAVADSEWTVRCKAVCRLNDKDLLNKISQKDLLVDNAAERRLEVLCENHDLYDDDISEREIRFYRFTDPQRYTIGNFGHHTRTDEISVQIDRCPICNHETEHFAVSSTFNTVGTSHKLMEIVCLRCSPYCHDYCPQCKSYVRTTLKPGRHPTEVYCAVCEKRLE